MKWKAANKMSEVLRKGGKTCIGMKKPKAASQRLSRAEEEAWRRETHAHSTKIRKGQGVAGRTSQTKVAVEEAVSGSKRHLRKPK